MQKSTSTIGLFSCRHIIHPCKVICQLGQTSILGMRDILAWTHQRDGLHPIKLLSLCLWGSHLSCPSTSKEHCIQMCLNFVRHLEGRTHSHAIKSHPNDGGLPKDMQNMIRFLVNMSIGPTAARIINMNQTEIVCGGLEQLDVSTKSKHRSIHCNVSLKFYGLNDPEGSFAQSVSSAEGECISCQFCTLTWWRECGLEAFRYYFSLPCYGFGGKLWSLSWVCAEE